MPKVRVLTPGRPNKIDRVYAILCPACYTEHYLDGVTWNEDLESPSFYPSVMFNGIARPTKDEMIRSLAGEMVKSRPVTCSGYINNGTIHFLPESTHQYTGQTLPLLEVGR